jgi:hypothetical protein
MRLNDPEMKPTIDAIRLLIQQDLAFGRELLRQTGIVTAKGRLARVFGG